MTGQEVVISRYLLYSCHGTGLYISNEALQLYYGHESEKMFSKIMHIDPIRTDPAFYDTIQKLGVYKTFNPFEYDIAFKSGGCPITFEEFYTHSYPSIIPFESWFVPIIHEYDGLESIKDIRMLTPQLDLMKKIQKNPDLTNEERYVKYEQILLLEPPIIHHRRVELRSILPGL
jgi:hypothetical protein